MRAAKHLRPMLIIDGMLMRSASAWFINISANETPIEFGDPDYDYAVDGTYRRYRPGKKTYQGWVELDTRHGVFSGLGDDVECTARRSKRLLYRLKTAGGIRWRATRQGEST